MRRPALLIAGATLWLFLAAVPVLADGGVHVADSNSGYSTLTADSCAGCHRAHTAQGEYLINQTTVDGLCLTCHGSTSSGATADVVTGLQYALAGNGTRGTGVIGALRDGGFVSARIDTSNPVRYTYYRTATDLSTRPKVGVSGPVAVTSSHLSILNNGVTSQGTLWGNGAAGSGVGATNVELECTSCHNPHGNGQYRILNDMPAVTGTGFTDPVVFTITSASATTGRFTTSRSHGFVVGDIVTLTVSGSTPAFSGQYIIKSIPTGNTFTVAAAPTKTSADITGSTIAITGSVTGSNVGSVQRYSTIVDDAPLPSPGDERNYTVMQVRGYQGDSATYLLYASDVLNARTANGVNLIADVVGLTASNDRVVTGLAHGFAINDQIEIAGLSAATTTASGLSNGTYYVKSIPNSTSVTLSTTLGGATVDITGNATATSGLGDKLGTATKFVAGTFSATSGDYFHRSVPWNPQGVNPACTYSTFTDTSNSQNPDYASACLTANDAPNGRPATVNAMIKVNTTGSANVTPSAFGQVAFNDQISAWCSACHSRYYSSTNPNPGTQSASSADVARTVTGIASNTITVGATDVNGQAISGVGFSVGDQVQFIGGAYSPTNLAGNTYYVVYAGSSSTGDPYAFKVSTTWDGAVVSVTGASSFGTVVRLYPASSSSWWFPRPGESLYKYQHQTTTNRACVTCHVAHGSPAQMTGTYSSTYTYPDGTPSDDSRLLKIDNRGTCQACHDPTGTATAGQLLPLSLGGTPPSIP